MTERKKITPSCNFSQSVRDRKMSATVDSSARHPPPRCHANTRQRTLSILQNWVNDPQRCWKAIWLRGYAGTGKSAAAQTFGESCIEKHRLGAAYFFSRTNGRNDQKTVIPTIAYQLSLHLVEYRALLASYIANDPAIFEKTPRTQFRHLIVEPLSMLQMSDQSFFKEPLVIILDGLDECKGIDEQCELVEMIGEVVRLKTDLPLLWLITSRPELHLKSLFSRAEFAIACGREILVIDAETRDDVERFLRDGFDGIRARYPYVTDASWPSLEQFGEVAYVSSGLFVLASTIIKYIGDPSCGNPVRRLENFLAFVENAKFTATDSPLQSCDLLYSQILSDIPTDVLPTTKRIINAFIQSPGYLSVQALCNFLSLAKHEFYHALTGLHSLFDIPPPEEAAQASLKMYHASFTDYIVNSSRSGRFCVDARDDQTTGSFEEAATVDAILPDLTWSSPETELDVSRAIKRAVVSGCWYSCVIVPPKTAPGGLLAQIKHFNFGCMRLERGLHLYHFFRWLFETVSR
ncbi:hypothetical protein AGABI1DRAFT_101598 [Agaricus bisporus var. burnettii JB137-S8]|uniref:Nephrocystin 3-like N-terminal domain-containing protein n=1 Tax=Agaricus bisporus var. burnettii (strain JB137-S8 / ATCC MYA-4627 / FGSC 10392) TaxID=597362 RepID=K5XRL8_AGABU|nr:uncharacterized protein AGABI1DRAFT_101598 [Agaricus bisporus var. burnettii JB137-S8]EKM77530.1 hypothetical protein AGABI1DRAFT_101598 [Agaricus bisporus var. burnettii JB137-S8]